MFLVRSAFWLTVAFIVIRPGDVDLGAAANALSGQAMAAGQKVVIEQILKNDCSVVSCAPAVPARAPMTASIRLPSAGSPMQDSPATSVPFPRPRPDWMG